MTGLPYLAGIKIILYPHFFFKNQLKPDVFANLELVNILKLYIAVEIHYFGIYTKMVYNVMYMHAFISF